MRPGLLRLIGIVIALAAADRCAAALPSIVFDLRVHDTGGKEVTLINPGDSVTLDLYTVASGLNGTSVDDNVTWINGSFLSSQGGLLGDLQGLPVPSIRTPPSTVGTAQDLDSDGDLDVGGTTPSSATGYYLSDQPLSIPLSVPPQLAGGTLLGQVQFTLKAPGNLTTSVTWSSRPALQGLIAYFDGNTADSYDWDPMKLNLSYSPVTIRGARAGRKREFAATRNGRQSLQRDWKRAGRRRADPELYPRRQCDADGIADRRRGGGE